MGNTIVFALVALVVLLLVICCVVWQVGQKKLKALSGELSELNEQRNTLNGHVAVLEEKCKRIEPLEHDLSRSQDKHDKIQAEILKVSSDFAAEVEKNKSISDKNKDLHAKVESLNQEVASSAARLKELEKISSECEVLQSRFADCEAKIAQLNRQVQEEQARVEEKTVLINSIKKLYA